MILSNIQIRNCLQDGRFSISDLPPALDPGSPPFNTSAIDLRLASEVLVPRTRDPVALDLRRGGIAQFLTSQSDRYTITDNQPYALKQNQLVLAKTMERVDFPIRDEGTNYSARVEGKSSLARCGILVHFTAPTIHAGFNGTITLEIINLGPFDFLLYPGLSICQLIIEEVSGTPVQTPSQFRGQSNAAGRS